MQLLPTSGFKGRVSAAAAFLRLHTTLACDWLIQAGLIQRWGAESSLQASRQRLCVFSLAAALAAGPAAGAIAVIATYPLDLVRTRLAWATESPAQQQTAAAGEHAPASCHINAGASYKPAGGFSSQLLAGRRCMYACALLLLVVMAGVVLYSTARAVWPLESALVIGRTLMYGCIPV